MSTVMLQLATFQFSIDTAAYQSLTRSTEYRWARQPRIGVNDALQFTGLGAETIELDGVIYPDSFGGFGQIDRIRSLAGLGAPLPLVSGVGRVLGLWVVEAVTEGQTIFAKQGKPRRQNFNIRLARYDGGLRSILRN